jgi:hypothetical protein
MTTTLIRHPGLSGPFGALMDDYARAAEDLCRLAAASPAAGTLVERLGSGGRGR